MIGIFFLSAMTVAIGSLLDGYVKELNKNNMIINHEKNEHQRI